MVLWVGCFREEIRVFILYECNEEVITDIFKMEDLFGMNFFIMYYVLFCDYEKKIGIKFILEVCP